MVFSKSDIDEKKPEYDANFWTLIGNKPEPQAENKSDDTSRRFSFFSEILAPEKEEEFDLRGNKIIGTAGPYQMVNLEVDGELVPHVIIGPDKYLQVDPITLQMVEKPFEPDYGSVYGSTGNFYGPPGSSPSSFFGVGMETANDTLSTFYGSSASAGSAGASADEDRRDLSGNVIEYSTQGIDFVRNISGDLVSTCGNYKSTMMGIESTNAPQNVGIVAETMSSSFWGNAASSTGTSASASLYGSTSGWYGGTSEALDSSTIWGSTTTLASNSGSATSWFFGDGSTNNPPSASIFTVWSSNDTDVA